MCDCERGLKGNTGSSRVLWPSLIKDLLFVHWLHPLLGFSSLPASDKEMEIGDDNKRNHKPHNRKCSRQQDRVQVATRIIPVPEKRLVNHVESNRGKDQ